MIIVAVLHDRTLDHTLQFGKITHSLRNESGNISLYWFLLYRRLNSILNEFMIRRLNRLFLLLRYNAWLSIHGLLTFHRRLYLLVHDELRLVPFFVILLNRVERLVLNTHLNIESGVDLLSYFNMWRLQRVCFA